MVGQIWTVNAYRNFIDLIACPETGEALAVETFDAKTIFLKLREPGNRW
ncbi:MAG: hypothetical protein OXC14_14915 [Rhodospirillaceae bacterium]|nr:hypothetical protein [Rhodospirillaceae bacterium]